MQKRDKAKISVFILFWIICFIYQFVLRSILQFKNFIGIGLIPQHFMLENKNISIFKPYINFYTRKQSFSSLLSKNNLSIYD